MTSNKNKKIIIPLLIVAAIFVMSAIVMWLWNAVLPDLLNVSTINYWQALGLFVLCKILFGGYAGKGRRSRFCSDGEHWRQSLSGMSFEDKSKLLGEWRKRCAARSNKEKEN